jgi:hypothetical protein
MRVGALLALVPMLVLAGCASPSGPAPAQASVLPEATPATAMAVDFTGDTGPAECVHGLPTQVACVNSRGDSGPFALGERTYIHPDTDGALSAILSVEWTPVVPAAPDLRVEWGVYANCPDACEMVQSIGETTGPSPIAVEVQGLALDAGEQFGVYLRASQRLPAGEVEATPGQSFTITGDSSFVAA